jgi:spore germination cell wall hydrolase CwlJ-like protein
MSKSKELALRITSLVWSFGVVFGFLAYHHMTWHFSLTPLEENELHWLAKAVYFEARGESDRGQEKVATVVLKRMNNHRWPDTVFEVVTEGKERLHRCQFSFMCDGKKEVISDPIAWKKAQAIAARVYRRFLRQQRLGKAVEVGCAHSYHADYATNTRWFKTLQEEERVGTHIFYCDKQVEEERYASIEDILARR